MSLAQNKTQGHDHDGDEGETRPLLSTSSGRRSAPVDIRLMRYVDVPRAALTKRAAFADDPVFRYMQETPDDWHPRLTWFLDLLVDMLAFSEHVSARDAWVIDGGYAYLVVGLPGHERSFFGRVVGFGIRFLRMFRTKEQKRRPIETMSKQNAAIEAGLEGRVNEMFAVDDIAVHPKRQGLGYGSALMAAARAKADALGLFSWLSSSNITNTAFYEHCGFKTVQEFAIGDNNPTWTEPPIILKIMCREARKQVDTKDGL